MLKYKRGYTKPLQGNELKESTKKYTLEYDHQSKPTMPAGKSCWKAQGSFGVTNDTCSYPGKRNKGYYT